MNNYVGVSGPVNISDVCAIINSFRETNIILDKEYVPMVGFLVNKKTLYGIPPKEGKIPHQRYPAIDKLTTLMEYSNDDLVNAIHFSPKGENFSEDIIRLFEVNDIYRRHICKTLQVNTLWPSKSELEKILTTFSDIDIIIQIPKKGVFDKNIGNIVESYNGLIKGALIDSSGGSGSELAVDIAASCYLDIKEKNPELVVGIAGGFSGLNAKKIISNFSKIVGSKDFSVDAEGKLRTNDMLDPNKVWHYISNVDNELSKTLKTW